MSQPLRVAVVDLATKAPSRTIWSRVMSANLAGIMSQVVAVWCQRAGHEVTFVCYTGLEDLASELPDDVDVVFISAFSQGAQLAYALSHLYRSRGAITALGGAHARCYPDDARRHFDYVFGFTDEALLKDVLDDCQEHRPLGVAVAANQQPTTLPGVKERWPFIEPTLAKAPVLKIVPMLSSMGCPYTCSFCIDAEVPYAGIEPAQITEDLRFLSDTMRHPRVSWHDPNFGVRFDEVMDAIEAAAPPGHIEFIAESSLSLLSEPRLKRLKHVGCKAVLPGIESWYELGFKSRLGRTTGLDKVRQVSEHVTTILEYVPYVQTNLLLGLDGDAGPEPFELTKQFIDLTPGAFPGYSLLTAFGEAAPTNVEFAREGRILPFPFHFLNNNHAMNVRPKNYSWPEFYDHVIDLTRYSFSVPTILDRLRANRGVIPRWMNVVRAISTEGWGRLRYHQEVRRLLDEDREFRRFFEQETTVLPKFYEDRVRADLGPLWEWLPPGGMDHDANVALTALAVPATS